MLVTGLAWKRTSLEIPLSRVFGVRFLGRPHILGIIAEIIAGKNVNTLFEETRKYTIRSTNNFLAFLNLDKVTTQFKLHISKTLLLRAKRLRDRES